MILIEQNAERRLLAELRRIEPVAHNCCLQLKLSRYGMAARTLVVDAQNAARRRIGANGRQLYMCADGDIFILASHISREETEQLAAELAQRMGLNSANGVLDAYGLELGAGELLPIVQAKLERKQQLELACASVAGDALRKQA